MAELLLFHHAHEGLPNETVYAGFSLGAMPAQMLAQTRPGAKGALLFHGCVPPLEFGGPWPQGVPLQIHLMEADEWTLEGDLDAARELDETVESAELFLYPGDRRKAPPPDARRVIPPSSRRASPDCESTGQLRAEPDMAQTTRWSPPRRST